MSRANDIETLEKRPAESLLFNCNFSPKMQEDETISTIVSVTSAATTVGPTALTMGSPVISGQQIQFRLSGGTDGAKYLQTALVTTSRGNTLQCEGYLFVRLA